MLSNSASVGRLFQPVQGPQADRRRLFWVEL